MKLILEATEQKLSKDFEIVGNDVYSTASRKFLKQLDARVEELGLTYDQCRDAAKLFKKGDFAGALTKIWGRSRVKTNQLHNDGGSVEIYVYTIDGYGEFRETITRKGLTQYSHSIHAKYDTNPCPSFPLATVIDVSLSKANEKYQELMVKDAFLSRTTAAIYNILFVCMDGYDMQKVLSKYHLKLKQKL